MIDWPGAEIASMAAKASQRAARHAIPNGRFAINPPLMIRTPRESAELGGAVTRLLRALARRAGSGDLTALGELTRLEAVLDAQMRIAAIGLREQNGYSWREIGREVGVTPQAAQQRWG